MLGGIFECPPSDRAQITDAGTEISDLFVE
jgi:hypothetical protein